MAITLSPLIGEFQDNGRRLKLTSPLSYSDGEFTVTVPEGFVTDFNSVPRGLWNFFPPWQYPEAAVVHDFLYVTPLNKSRSFADATHRKILEHLGCSRWKRWAAWAAIRTFGRGYWNEQPD